MLNTTKGILVEYALAIPPLVLVFEFNPQSLSRTRTITLKTGNAPGTQGGYDFLLPTETPRVAQGVTVAPESFSMEILLDVTDRMNDGEVIATQFGIEPELDTLRSMVEPKSQGPGRSADPVQPGFGRRAGLPAQRVGLGATAGVGNAHPAGFSDQRAGNGRGPSAVADPLPRQGDPEHADHRRQQPLLSGGKGAPGAGRRPQYRAHRDRSDFLMFQKGFTLRQDPSV